MGLVAEDSVEVAQVAVGKQQTQQMQFNEEVFLCPRCKKDMKKIKRDDVILDICSKCGGMWLDRDEIPKLAQIAQERTIKK